MSELRRRVARLALENPSLRPHLMPLLRTAGFDFSDAIFNTIRTLDDQRRKVLDAKFKALIDKLEKVLLKYDFVLDRRKTYISDYYHHEGTRFEGDVVFVDKRDHYPRSKEEVEKILQKAAGIWGWARMVEPTVWKVHVGE